MSSVLALLRRYEREFVCGRCRGVIAWIRLRPFSLIRITDRDGRPVNPLGGIVATRITQTRLADPGTDVERYRRDLQYLRRAAGELIYEFDCTTCGARYLRSLPHLAATVRGSSSGRVELS